MQMNFSKFIFLVVVALLVPSGRADWDDFLWSNDDEEATETTTTEGPTPPPEFDQENICEHDALTIIILKFVLETQKQMKDGVVTPGLPSLEPFQIPKMEMDLVGTKHNYNVAANITEIVIAGLSNFEVQDIKTDVIGMSANLSVFLDKLTVSGKYHIKGFGRMVIPIPIYGKGRVVIESHKIQTQVHIEIGFSDEGELVLKEFDFGLGMSQINVKFQGLTGSMITKRWNEIINSMGLKMFSKMEPKIHDKIRERSIRGINKALVDMKFDWQMWQDVLAQVFSCYFE